MGIKLYNKLSNEIKNIRIEKVFKRELKKNAIGSRTV